MAGFFKTCSRCKETLPLSKFYKDKYKQDRHASTCKQCRILYHKKYYLNPINKKKAKETNSRWYSINKDYQKALSKKNWKDLRIQVINGYGGCCVCCGETELVFLSIDHINNDGAEHRKTCASDKLYRQLQKNNFPAGFQVLCRNCNWAKFAGGCPH